MIWRRSKLTTTNALSAPLSLEEIVNSPSGLYVPGDFDREKEADWE